jgi:hypothetical protein
MNSNLSAGAGNRNRTGERYEKLFSGPGEQNGTIATLATEKGYCFKNIFFARDLPD